MTNAPRVTKANGHIVQADWNQTDPLKMDYIHNKPEIFDGDYHNLKNKPDITETISQWFAKVNQTDFIVKEYRLGEHMIEVAGGRQESGLTVVYGEFQIPVPENIDVKISFVPGYAPNDLGIVWATCTDEYIAANGEDAGGWRVEQIAILEATHPEYGSQGVALGHLEYAGGGGSANSYWINDYESVTVSTEGMPYITIVLGEDNIPVSDISGFLEKYANVKIKIEYGENNFTPVHTTVLRSDTELHYNAPVTELTIAEFIESYDSQYAQQWVLSFIAGDTDPLVIVPSNVKYIGGAPWFQANKRYLLTFKKICDDIYCIWSVIE